MNVILCGDCGKVMSRYTTQCVRCHRDNLESFKDMNSDQFRTRIKLVEKHNERPGAAKSAVIGMMVAVTMSVITVGWGRLNPIHFIKTHKTTSRHSAAPNPSIMQ